MTEGRRKVALCLLVMNEREGCEHDVPQLPLDQFDEVFAVDGNSSDGTAEYLETAGIPVHRQPRPGYNASYIHAFDVCRSDALVFFHPKGTVPPADVLKFREHFEAGADLVIANRNMPHGRNEEDDKLFRPRKWFVLGLSAVTALLWRRGGVMVSDVLHGFRGMTVEAFRRIRPLEHGVSIDLEMVARAYKLGLSIAQFPTAERARPHGSSHFPALRTGARLMKYLLWEIRRRD